MINQISADFPEEKKPSITQLLNNWAQGHDQALNQLIPLVYADLQRRAKNQMWRERDDHTLQSTALVHEAFMRLGAQRGEKWVSRDQFLGWMTRLMRQILVDHARGRKAAKRDLGVKPQSIDALNEEFGEEVLASEYGAEWTERILALDKALKRLEKIDPRQARLVELRFFGGLDVHETAQNMSISEATVVREWKTARLWLLNELDK